MRCAHDNIAAVSAPKQGSSPAPRRRDIRYSTRWRCLLSSEDRRRFGSHSSRPVAEHSSSAWSFGADRPPPNPEESSGRGPRRTGSIRLHGTAIRSGTLRSPKLRSLGVAKSRQADDALTFEHIVVPGFKRRTESRAVPRVGLRALALHATRHFSAKFRTTGDRPECQPTLPIDRDRYRSPGRGPYSHSIVAGGFPEMS
jgi:hypothetical protein